ncbi:MAG: hypothetical protein MOB07_23310 [Acidobacteria bacterium]|nr:hypothetical protein [Acidobacteriota bacterium]
MGNTLFEKGVDGIMDGTVDLDTNTIKAALLDLATADAGIKAITGATNATPIVITATSHGFANGDVVLIGGVGGNQAANGIWKIANQAANTFELTNPITGGNASGSGTYTSGGYAVNLGPSASGDNWDDFSAAVIGTPQTLTSPVVSNGAFDSADVVFSSVSGNSVEAMGVYKDTGTESTSRMVAIMDGRHIVTCAATAAASATSIAVEPLAAPIPNSTVLAFSNGALATLTAAPAAGDRTLTVSSLAAQITAGSRADAPATGSGLPVTPNGGNINGTWDNGTPRIFKIRANT